MIYASSLVMHTKYHMAIGYAGTLALVGFQDAIVILGNREVHPPLKSICITVLGLHVPIMHAQCVQACFGSVLACKQLAFHAQSAL